MQRIARIELDPAEDLPNPLDHVEDVLHAHNWTFSRMTSDELTVQVTGKGCDYRLFFIWQEDMNAIQFCSQYDMSVPKANYGMAACTIMTLNENLWMGHFDLPKDTGIPTFRYTSLCRGGAATSEIIEDLIDISMAQCEKFFPLFQMLSTANDPDEKSLALALMETKGES